MFRVTRDMRLQEICRAVMVVRSRKKKTWNMAHFGPCCRQPPWSTQCLLQLSSLLAVFLSSKAILSSSVIIQETIPHTVTREPVVLWFRYRIYQRLLPIGKFHDERCSQTTLITLRVETIPTPPVNFEDYRIRWLRQTMQTGAKQILYQQVPMNASMRTECLDRTRHDAIQSTAQWATTTMCSCFAVARV
jgi:hypothetical protein